MILSSFDLFFFFFNESKSVLETILSFLVQSNKVTS